MKSKTEDEIVLMRKAGKITGDTLREVEKHIKPGVSSLELDKIAYEFIIKNDAVPSFLNYNGYPASICCSPNSVVVHGIPNKDIVLKEGDIVSIDVGAYYHGFHGDAARTFAVGKISEEKQRLIDLTKQSFFEGIKYLKVGERLGQLSNAIQTFAEKNGLSVVRELVGHGIGRHMHEDPNVPNYGFRSSGPIVVENSCIAIEPMLNLGRREVYMEEDGWTIKTADGKPSAHYENTVLITKNGVEILTI